MASAPGAGAHKPEVKKYVPPFRPEGKMKMEDDEEKENLSVGGKSNALKGGGRGGQGESRSGNFGKLNMRNGYPIFGFQRIKVLLSQPAVNAISAIKSDMGAWEEFLKTFSSSNNDLLLCMVVQLLAQKVCSEEVLLLPSVKNDIIRATATSSPFIALVNKKISGFMIASTFTAKLKPLSKENDSSSNVKVDTGAKEFIRNTFIFCSLVFKRAPETARDFLMNTVAFMNNVVVLKKSESPTEEEFEELITGMKSEIKKKKTAQLAKEALKKRRGQGSFTEEEMAALDTVKAPSNFRRMSVVPTMSELLSTQSVFLLPNKPRGAYLSADKYLETQFRLLKEDFTRPLREGIQTFLQDPLEYLFGGKKMPLGSIRLYDKVEILQTEIIHEKKHFWLQLPDRVWRGVSWDKSKRLLPGSLVILTNDLFRTGTFGVVGIRDEKRGLKDGRMTFIPDDYSATLQSNEYLLVEADGYFEAYRHILNTLQTLRLKSYPMAKFVVGVSADVAPPAYLLQSQIVLPLPALQDFADEESTDSDEEEKEDEEEDWYSLQLRALKFRRNLESHGRSVVKINPLDDKNWPSRRLLQLDENQFLAFKAALTQEFSIIQGPPGTGKTYLGLRIAEVLLHNWEVWMTKLHGRVVGPLVVVCLTNHALDQFLEGILRIKKKFKKRGQEIAMARLGGKSRSEKLKRYQLANQRRHSRWRNNLSQGFRECRRQAHKQVNLLSVEVQKMENLFMELGNPREGILDFEQLSDWDELLKEKFPSALWECLQSESFFEITASLFSAQNFDPVSICNNWFEKNVNSKLPKQTPRSDNGEEYDMEELMEQRIETEYHTSSHTHYNSHCFPSFVGISIPECNKNISECDFNIEYLSRRSDEKKEITALAAHRIYQLRCERTLHENRRKLLREIFRRCDSQEIKKLDIAEKIEQLRICSTVQECLTVLPDVKSRWAAYFLVGHKVKELLEYKKDLLEMDLIEAQERLSEMNRYADSQILRHCHVVGMTTTGAAKFHDLLQSMNSKILIVEEAAEVQESHIVTSFTKSCQHVILIGDHLQLKPSSAVYELETKYNMSVSLFERMINNNLHCHPLSVQHRMRPEISNLIRGTVYSKLVDAPATQNRPDVWGISKNVFFFSHTERETAEKDTLSKSNDFEAEFLLGLCRYLLRQGYAPEQITVLCTYTGQMFLLKKKFRDVEFCDEVRITCVDNFQGEENDIILLSLVRSNDEGNVGFLKVANRVCVALSRAKHGLYVVGNMEILSQGSEIWPKIKEKLEAHDEIGDCFPIVCQNHGTISKIFKSSEFVKCAPGGGCTLVCGSDLPNCPHKCPLICHLHDRDHSEYECLEICTKTCDEEEAHPCQDECFINPCKPCSYPVTVQLDCQHSLRLSCHQRHSEVLCYEIVEKMPPCNKHSTAMACHVDEKEYECKIKEVKILPCGHKKELECFQDVEEVRCRQQVEKTLPCSHTQMAQCFANEEDVECLYCEEVVRTLAAMRRAQQHHPYDLTQMKDIP